LDEILYNNSGSDIAYNSPYPGSRAEVSLTEIPVFDQHGDEIPVYNKGGFFIQRVAPLADFNLKPPGILANLRKMHHLFGAPWDEVTMDDDTTPCSVDGYSQAFTGFGNVQARSTMPAFQTRIGTVNKIVSCDQGEHAIKAPHFQGYNLQSHRTRYTADTHAAQTGAFTQLLSGTYNTGNKSTTRFEKLRIDLNANGLPHKSLSYTMQTSDPKFANTFRLEVVYVVDMNRLKNTHCVGR